MRLSDPSVRVCPARRKESAALRLRAALRGVGPPSPARGSPARGGGVPLPAAGAARPAPSQRGTDSCPERAPARRSPALPRPRAARSHPAPPPHPWTAAAGPWAAGPCRRCEPGRGAAEPRAAGTMDSILEPFAAERLFPAAGPGFLDLGDFSEADFLSNVHFSENLDHFSDNMEDFSNDLFSSFFDDPVLAEKNPLLDMDLDPPTPGIQAEHSYSLSGDSAPQSPLMPVKTEDNANELENGVWALGPKLCSIMVKQEQNLALDPPESQLAASSRPVLNLNPLQRLPVPEETPIEMTPAPVIKAEPKEVNQFLNVPAVDDLVQMPPTPPSSHGSDSDGSQSPRSLPPSSPARPAARSSTAISSSPLLTAPHKLQGTSGPLLLTEEEKRTLVAEGYPIPTKLPLTKAEEKALKRVRRKIKNKISAQESRRKKKEYVECLEKKVETYTTENNELWKKVETLESANRTLLQQLQKLQALVAGKVSRPYKMASTQTGTCLMVLVLCFVLILGSLMPCLPEFSTSSQTVKATPAPDIYTTSKIQSRSLLFYDEGAGSLEESYSSFLTMDHPEGWEAEKGQSDEPRPHLARTHETAKYMSKSHLENPDQNQTDPTLTHFKEQFHERETSSSETAEYL